MKKFIFGILFLALLAAIFVGWRVLGSATAFEGENYYLYIRTGMTYPQLLDTLRQEKVVKDPGIFNWVAGRMDYPANIKAGKYEIKSGMSVIGILRMLHNGRQVPVKIVITKFRTLEGLAGAIGRKLEADSAELGAYLHNNDSLNAFGVDSSTLMAIVMPNTYSCFWNTPPSALFRKMYTAYKAWWTPARVQQAKTRGLTPVTATTLASIVEEETNAQSDKGKIASVYLNRIAKGEKLQADPTVKYAMRDFELTRIYYKYLTTESPYNTYLHTGLPPGPVCTPSEPTLKAVIESPTTDYMYFVAKPDFSGYSNFAASYKDHLVNKKAFEDAQNKQQAIRAAKDSANASKK